MIFGSDMWTIFNRAKEWFSELLIWSQDLFCLLMQLLQMCFMIGHDQLCSFHICGIETLSDHMFSKSICQLLKLTANVKHCYIANWTFIHFVLIYLKSWSNRLLFRNISAHCCICIIWNSSTLFHMFCSLATKALVLALRVTHVEACIQIPQITARLLLNLMCKMLHFTLNWYFCRRINTEVIQLSTV
jgi:hypothetical protein